MTSSRDGAAVALLKRAVDLDARKRKTEALVCYKEGLQLLMDVIKGLKEDDARKAAYRTKATEYMTRAEQLQVQIEAAKRAGNFHEQIKVEEHATGFSYQNIFGRFLDGDVTCITVEDPYVRQHHQVMNFLRFCELAVKNCGSLAQLTLLTSKGDEEQAAKLNEIKEDLRKSHKVALEVTFSETLHDREVRTNTGWIIKVGRGLDIYKAPKGRFSIGVFDLDLRPCLETTIDIFHRSQMTKKHS